MKAKAQERENETEVLKAVKYVPQWKALFIYF